LVLDKPEQDAYNKNMRRRAIYVLATFRMEGGVAKELEPRFWFHSKASVLRCLKKAGKPVPHTENIYYDEPFEYRWNYCIVEKVFEGPMSTNEVIGFWHAEYTSDTKSEGEELLMQRSILKVKKCKPPFDISGSFNFTGIGS